MPIVCSTIRPQLPGCHCLGGSIRRDCYQLGIDRTNAVARASSAAEAEEA